MYAESYRRGFDRVVSFMREHDPDVVVPACPAWTAGDVVRHLTGLAADLVNGVVDGYASDAWTAAQIEARSEASIDEVIDEWSGVVDDAAARLDDLESIGLPPVVRSDAGSFPVAALAPMAIGDILHHEFDLRNAYGDTEGRDLMDLHFLAAGHVKALRPLFTAAGLPTVRVESTDAMMGWDIGRDEPVATLRATSFEIMRAIGGRRTREEILSMDWEGDPEPFIDSFTLPHLSPPERSLGES